jgi:multidrug efflux pump subunit AcrA (membrane-fusion protein)
MRIGHWVLVIAVVVAAAAGGWWAGDRSASDGAAPSSRGAGDGACSGGADPLYWKAPMDPTYVRDEPGKSPMGMDLVPVCPGEGAAFDGEGIQIDSALVQNMGVRMAPVVRRDLSREVRTVGRVAYDERRVDHVHTKVQGWIERLFVQYEGELVRRGQPLLEIYSPELVSTQEELLLAARYRDSTRESGFEDVARGGEKLFLATRRRLELWDISKRDIERLLETGDVRKNLTLYAPTEGVVTHLMVRKGMEVGANDNLYTIADLSRVWVYADVYEYELPWVREGQNAIVDLSYLPGRSFEGVVTYVYPFLDPKSRTARARVELDNPDMILKPDMFANVTIETETRHGVLAVPEEAVIRSGRRSLAIVALGEGRFSPRDVVLGINSGGGWIEVQDGLAEGDSVVTSGQFLIDSESKLQEAVQKMLGPKAAAGTEHAGHAMPEDSAETDPHAGHVMPEESTEADPHAGHAMPEDSAETDPHAGHRQE